MKINKINHKLLFWLVPIVLGSTSCEKIIPIDIPDTQRKIVVNGLISPSVPVVVNLTKSLTVLENGEFVYLENANVKLYENGNLAGTLTPDTAGYYRFPAFTPVIGNTYKLTVDYPGLAPVEAETTIPSSVGIVSVDTSRVVNEWGQEIFKIKVVFDDPAEQDNIYGYSVALTYKEFDYLTMQYTGKWITQPGWVYEENNEFVEDEIHYYGQKAYIEDHLFNGQSRTLDLRLSGFEYLLSDTVKVDVNLEQISPEFYTYVVSSEAYQRSHRNPFSEPVQVYTNIQGGFGIFSSYTVNTRTFIVRK
jgi:hypothetical protein